MFRPLFGSAIFAAYDDSMSIAITDALEYRGIDSNLST